MRKKVGLSLSGGGTKAMLYIGVLEALIENNIPVDIIGGLSGGALVASLYALGKTPKEIIDIAYSVNFFKLFDLSPRNGYQVLDRDKVYALIKEIVGDVRIEDLKLPLLIFSSELNKRETITFKEGELAFAMISSCCIPGFMRPTVRNDLTLVDGGFSVKFGAKYFREAGADVVIGVNLDKLIDDRNLPVVARNIVKSIRILIKKNQDYEKILFPIDIEINGFNDGVNMFYFRQIKSNLPQIGYNTALEFMPNIQAKIT